MKYLVTVVLVFSVSYNAFAQNPEAGWFFSLKIQHSSLETNSAKYEGMGWSDTPTGEYAFEFSANLLKVYAGGAMGADYRVVDDYVVLSRKRFDTSEHPGLDKYEYFGKNKDEGIVRFVIHVKDDGEYKAALLYVYSDVQENRTFNRLTYFILSRQFK